MDDPQKDIPDVVNVVTAAVNPDIQKAAVLRYVYMHAQKCRTHPLLQILRARRGLSSPALQGLARTELAECDSRNSPASISRIET